MRRFRVIGPGHAGRAMALALARAGWHSDGILGRHDDPSGAAAGVDLLLIATPDAAVGEVAAAIRADEGTTVAHLSGALTLEALRPHPRRASIHPLVPLPAAERGAARLLSGSWFAAAGEPRAAEDLALEVITALGGRRLAVPEDDRAAYHAAACIAANHLVALMGQVERVVGAIGLPLSPFVELASAALHDTAEFGPAGALTGPAARGDTVTIGRHRAALSALAPDELAAYDAMVEQAARLAGRHR